MTQPNICVPSGHLKVNPRQIWFFTFEKVHDPVFTQGHHVLPSPGTVKYLGLPQCLAYSGYRTKNPYRLDYYMLSQSIKKAIYLRSDESVLETWKKYCRNDAVVHIIIRPRASLTPNQFHAASHYESLTSRRATLSRYFYPTQPNLPGRELEPEIWDIHEKVADLVVDDGTFVKIERNVLLELIKNAMYARRPLQDLQVSVFNQQRKIKRFTVTAKSWKLLAHSPWKEHFACLYKSYKAELKMKSRGKSRLWQFLIEIGLASPGKAHVCKKCRKAEEEKTLLETTRNDMATPVRL
jgi:hypothetical protein